MPKSRQELAPKPSATYSTRIKSTEPPIHAHHDPNNFARCDTNLYIHSLRAIFATSDSSKDLNTSEHYAHYV